jgi:inorganic pyrophosphatase
MSDVIDVFVEIPKGSRNKYEWDHHLRRFVLDRMLFSAVHYPGDYGFVPDTFAEDGDPSTRWSSSASRRSPVARSARVSRGSST